MTTSFTILDSGRPEHRRRRRRGDLRSLTGTSEGIVAAELGRLGIDYQYEARLYVFSDGTGFRPDFYLPASGVVIEVTTTKWPRRKLEKIERFKAEYGDPVVLIGYEELGAIATSAFDLSEAIRDAIHASNLATGRTQRAS